MKKGILFFGLVGALLASCSSADQAEEKEVVVAEYTLDAAKSTLNWHGEENEQHFHDGTIQVVNGTMTTEDGTPTAGTFTIDSKSVLAKTEGYPEEKLQGLTQHLQDTAFLFVAEYPEVIVTTGAYKDGKLNTTIDFLGQKITEDIPVTVTTSADAMHIHGDFTIDFAASGMKYITEVNPQTGAPGAKSTFTFNMDLHLTKN